MNAGGGFIAGSIIGKMVLDMTGWTQSIAKVDADGKALGTKFDRIGQKMQDVGTKMTIVGAAVVASLSAMIIKAAKYGDEMVEVSQKVGINVTTLSSYKLAADKTGISIDGLARAIKFMSVNMVEASKGIGDGATLFGDLGVSATDSNGALRDTNDVLGDVAQKFSEMEDGAEKVTLATKLFGKAGMDLIPFLNLGRDGLAKERIEAERLGLVLSGPAADAQNKFNDQLDALKDATLGASMAIGSALIPAANAIVKIMIDAAAGVVAWTKEHPGLTKAIGTVVLALGGLLSILGPLTIAIGAVLKNIVYLKAAASTSIIFTITLVGAAVLVKAISDYNSAFTKMRDSMKEAGSSGFIAFLEGVNSGWRKVALGINDANIIMSAANRETISVKGAMILLGEAFRAIKGSIEAGAITPIVNLTALFKEFGLKTRTELTAELAKAEEALRLLKGSAEATPGAIKALEDKIVSLKEGITGVTKVTTKLAETWAPNASGMILLTNGAISVRDVMQGFAGDLTNTFTPAARDMSLVMAAAPGLLDAVGNAATDLEYVFKAIGDAMGVSANTVKVACWNMQADVLAAMGIIIPKIQSLAPATQATIKTMAGYFEGLFNDIAIGLGNAIQGFLTGWTDAEKAAIQGIRDAVWALDNEFKTAQDALDQKYKDGLISQEDYLNQSKTLLDDYNKAHKKLADDMATHITGFAKFFKEVWGSIKTAFFRVIGEMIAEWVINFVKNLILGAVTAATGVGTALTTIVTSVTTIATTIATIIGTLVAAVATAVVTMATAIATALVTLATGIASAATIIAAAAPAIIVTALLALGILSALKLLERIFGSKSGAGDGMGRVVERQDIQISLLTQLRDYMKGDIWNEYRNTLWHISEKMDAAVRYLSDIAGDTKSLSNSIDDLGQDLVVLGNSIGKGLISLGNSFGKGLISLGKLGGVEWTPQVVHVAASAPEVSMPIREYRNAAASAGASGRNSNVNLTFNIRALDGTDMINVVHNKIKPILQNILNHNGLRVPTGAVGGA